MQSLQLDLEQEFRPRLLVSAAQFGRCNYKRKKHLRGIIGEYGGRKARCVLRILIELERECEHKRKLQDASYSFQRHVEVLIALLAEYDDMKSSSIASSVVNLPLNEEELYGKVAL